MGTLERPPGPCNTLPGGPPTDIVLLGHGSRRTRTTDVGLAEVVRRMQARVLPPTRVRLAGFEFTRPNLTEAVEGLACEGSRRIVVTPFFVFEGRHVLEEIPEELDRLRASWPHVELLYALTLGHDPRMVDVVIDRVRQSLSPVEWEGLQANGHGGPAADGRRVGVVLVNRGSRRHFDPEQRVRAIVDGVRERLGPSVLVHHAQAEYEWPRVEDGCAAVIEAGAQLVVVVPYIFFPGKVLFDNIRPAVSRSAADHPGVEHRLTRVLGVDDRLIAIALDRAVAAGFPAAFVRRPESAGVRGLAPAPAVLVREQP